MPTFSTTVESLSTSADREIQQSLYPAPMNMGKRIAQRLRELGWKQTDLLNRVPDLSPGTLSAIILRDSKRSEFVSQIAVALNVTTRWLQDGEEPKEPSGLAGMHSKLAHGANGEIAPKLSKSRFVPVVGTAQLGDNGFWSELEHPTGHGDGGVNAWTSDENAYAIRCRGNSMSPRIKDGEFVVVSPKEIPIPGDEVLIRHVDGRVMVKQFLYERDGVIHVMSVNESHPPQSFMREEIERFNLVVAILKRGMWVPP